MTSRRPIPYRPDPSGYFSLFAAEPWSIWFDSGFPHGKRGRFDILLARPFQTLTCNANSCVLDENGAKSVSEEEPFALLERLLATNGASSADSIFSGGVAGYFAYDLARREGLLASRDDLAEPLCELGFYGWAVVIDHVEERAWLTVACPDIVDEQTFDRLHTELCAAPEGVVPRRFEVIRPARPSMDKSAYFAAFDRIKHYLHEGDCYQVNLTQPFLAQVSGDPFAAYLDLRRINPSPFGAYLNFPDRQILSFSPERFLRVEHGIVETKPIKGTRPRDSDPVVDGARIVELNRSTKDRAENLMIVDLLRNDLGKVCVSGSVKVDKLFDVESFATVHHLVSTIHGKLQDGQSAASLLRAAFPGGSVTGAPKKRAMAIIEELEVAPRGIYCGTIGYLGFDGRMDSNIAIRTLVHRAGELSFNAGGGIVYDSDGEEEYQESIDKAAVFLRQFGATGLAIEGAE